MAQTSPLPPPPPRRRIREGFLRHHRALVRGGIAVESFALHPAWPAQLLTVPPARACDADQMRAAQRRYIGAQRQNQHTRRMLAGCVGAGLADRFIAECLFPEPPPAALAA
jgi:hypothetical protein